ncbi:hypothetical protein TCAL_03864 [Tigriopus californicus]|uniref:Histone deacetylase n=2 Tax=Tigriopus californicus TaxID=6832 RepID=A0A553PF73_TIGCA|nr:hypothetical protein TCAL_03864 [Tigriopus californicus]|eukprot:TCALIF_03864-PA protein Name:"Similar to HDAC8 Histone deacetylase 8 (Homo sapiens)" AED:0.07 eAED:0.07 QI:134/1/1/1/1/1/5/160/393
MNIDGPSSVPVPSGLTHPAQSSGNIVQTATTPITVCLIEDPRLLAVADDLPAIRGRASRVSSLLRSYGITSQLQVIPAPLASVEDLNAFHSWDYLEVLQKLEADDELPDEVLDDYGLLHDCPILPKILTVCRVLGGGSIKAAQCLANGSGQVSVNWHGGWHHAQRDHAAGFCYVNDAVLAILELKKTFSHVLYLDLDIHHGDGVENAFAFTPNVFVASIHLWESGFYPGSGTAEDQGLGRGQGFSLNVPLKRGTTDERFTRTCQRLVDRILEKFQPDAIVCQLGCDGLNGDPLGGFNLTQEAYVNCVAILKRLEKPLLLLGGGGYIWTKAAITWTSVMASIMSVHLPLDIPEDDLYFLEYGPSYDRLITKSNIKDENSDLKSKSGNYGQNLIS